MSLWSRIFGGGGFQDEAMVEALQKVLLEDPLITDPTTLRIESKEGVITLSGSVDRTLAKDHVEGAVRDALRYKSLKFKSIVNNISVKHGSAV